MRWSSRSSLSFGWLLVALSTAACGGWHAQGNHDVRALPDPNATFSVVLDTLHAQKYAIIDQDVAGRGVRVRSHIDEHEPSHVSIILIQVDGAAVHLSAAGYLVHPDGTTHHRLNSELALLQKQLSARLGAGAPPPAIAPAATATLPPAPSAPPGSLPVAWSEPAYDPTVWGHGNFTCLPVKLALADQAQLTLKLSNGETADVLLSLAYAPELCRAPGECKLAGGCPALGIGDPDRVSRIAGRLSRHEVGALATLFFKGQPVATIDLAKHGSIAAAMTDKH
ncbi:MAG: hypothetical protein ABJB12_18635 [Pseudomonadota bacterium]